MELVIALTAAELGFKALKILLLAVTVFAVRVEEVNVAKLVDDDAM